MNQQMMMKIRKMQKQMEETQKELENTCYTGTAGGGMVSVEMMGTHEVKKVTIDKEAFESKDDIEMIEDTIVAALNDAARKLEQDQQTKMAPFTSLAGGLF